MSNLKAFTTQIMNFLTELTEMFPNDADIQKSFHGVEFIKKTNPRLLHSMFVKYIYEYRDQLEERNDKFFIEKEDSEYYDLLNIQVKDYMKYSENDLYRIISKVRDYWGIIDQPSKENIWLYLKILFKLSDRLLHV